jgi:hypothetical protein
VEHDGGGPTHHLQTFQWRCVLPLWNPDYGGGRDDTEVGQALLLFGELGCRDGKPRGRSESRRG